MPDKILSTVIKYNKGDDEKKEQHVHDLRYTALMVRNDMIGWLRRGCGKGKFSIIDAVLEYSKVIQRVTLTDFKVEPIEQGLKEYAVNFYFEQGADHGYNYRLPNKTNDFKRFGAKKDRVKDAAVTVVLEMYVIYQENLLTDDQVEELNSQWVESKRKADKARAERKKKRNAYEKPKEIDLDSLYDRVLENVNSWKPYEDEEAQRLTDDDGMYERMLETVNNWKPDPGMPW